MERRKFTGEFKIEAVKLIKERGGGGMRRPRKIWGFTRRSAAQVGEGASRSDPQHAFPGHGQLKPEAAEIARLKREVTKLKAERDILKKAAAYFAKESM